MTQLEASEISKIVKETLESNAKKFLIVDMQVETDDDSDGEPIYRIYVIFDEKNKMDADIIIGAARSVHPRLVESGYTAFPVFYFVSKLEWQRRYPK